MTYDVGVMGNGALAGLVAITSGCSVIYPWGAIPVGFVAGFLYVIGSRVSIFLKVGPPHRPDLLFQRTVAFQSCCLTDHHTLCLKGNVWQSTPVSPQL